MHAAGPTSPLFPLFPTVSTISTVPATKNIRHCPITTTHFHYRDKLHPRPLHPPPWRLGGGGIAEIVLLCTYTYIIHGYLGRYSLTPVMVLHPYMIPYVIFLGGFFFWADRQTRQSCSRSNPCYCTTARTSLALLASKTWLRNKPLARSARRPSRHRIVSCEMLRHYVLSTRFCVQDTDSVHLRYQYLMR